MIFRYRRYAVVPGKAEAFTRFFLERLLPVQQRHGARLVGRWQSAGGLVVVALWAYESDDAFHEIQEAVRRDPDMAAALQHRREQLDPLVEDVEELILRSTVPLALTELAALGGS